VVFGDETAINGFFSECALDQWSPWTLTIANNGEAALLEKDLQALISSITAFL